MTESQLHTKIVKYLKREFPGTYFETSLSGIKLPKPQAVHCAALQSGAGIPDLKIFVPAGGYCGLAIELKKDFDSLYNKNGSRKKSEHLDRQEDWMNQLIKCGWFGGFCCGYEQTIENINNYMELANIMPLSSQQIKSVSWDEL